MVMNILDRLSPLQQIQLIHTDASGDFFQKHLKGCGTVVGLSVLCGFYDIFQELIKRGGDLEKRDLISGNTVPIISGNFPI